MGISIEAKPGPVPRRCLLTLECDELAEFFCRGFEMFDHPEGYIGGHRDAMTAGWLERQTASGRKWLCPRCSGKVSG